MRYLLFSVLVIFSIGVFAVPGAFADVTVYNAVGSATPGCEPNCFIPSTVTIGVGETVTWENTDNAAHTATSGHPTDGPSGTFDSSLVMAGGSYSHTFDSVGTYPYFCMVHPWMQGTVIVEAAEATQSSSNSTSTTPPPEPEAETTAEPEVTPTISVSTDKTSYIAGIENPVQISGTVENSDIDSVAVTVKSSNGNIVAVFQADIEPDGSFSWTINTKNLNTGTYTISPSSPCQSHDCRETTFTVIQNPNTVYNTAGSATPGCEENDTCFMPSTIAIAIGETVTWENTDNAAHTATSGSSTDGPSGVWDSSLIQAGGSYSYTFDEPGSYDYFCMVHPWMQGTVVVGDAAEIEAFVVAQEAVIAAEEAAAAAADAVWAEANPGVVKNAPGSATPGCEETNDCFIPSTITVSAGQGITWYNDDNAAHTATSGTPTDGPSGAFDTSLMMAGGSFNLRIDEPGTYPYFCMVHPWMQGTVIVEATEQTEDESEQIEFEPTPEVVETEAEVVSESDEITTGSEIQIETDIVNQKDDSQIFAYIVQIKYEDGTPVSISTVTGSLAQGQTLTQTISWTPDEPGTYVAEIFIWDDLDSANPLSSVEVQYFTVT